MHLSAHAAKPSQTSLGKVIGCPIWTWSSSLCMHHFLELQRIGYVPNNSFKPTAHWLRQRSAS